MTRVLTVHPESPDPGALAQAAAVIRRGGLVAFPTETVYGLGAHALDAEAVLAIFQAKGRPPTDPLIVHLGSVRDLTRVARDIPAAVHDLAEAFWPGPLTLVLRKQSIVPDCVTAGLGTVAVRVPAHKVALALLRECRAPIAAPSANRFGGVSPTTAKHVVDDLGSRIDLILDAGPTPIGVESTVLDVCSTPPRILRPGGVTRESLEELLGRVEVNGGDEAARAEVPQLSPGLLARHYAPRAELILCTWEETPQHALEMIVSLARLHQSRGRRVGLLVADEDRPFVDELSVCIVSAGPAADLAQVARNLYAALRMLDDMGVEIILARDFSEQGLGLAVRDRLRRAAAQVVVATSGSSGSVPN